jgi:cell division protein FtsL
MMADGFEYAVRKDVRNNPIVREVDAERQAEMWKMLGLASLLVMALMFWTWQHFELIRHGYKLEELQRQMAVEDDTARHLRLEIETLKSPRRIETIARGRLGLVTPTRADAVVIERVVPAEPPAKSVIARR